MAQLFVEIKNFIGWMYLIPVSVISFTEIDWYELFTFNNVKAGLLAGGAIWLIILKIRNEYRRDRRDQEEHDLKNKGSKGLYNPAKNKNKAA